MRPPGGEGGGGAVAIKEANERAIILYTDDGGGGREQGRWGPRAQKSEVTSAQATVFTSFTLFTIHKREIVQSPTDGRPVVASIWSGVDIHFPNRVALFGRGNARFTKYSNTLC